MKSTERFSAKRSDLPCPYREYANTPQPVPCAICSGKSFHIETHPRPSCSITMVVSWLVGARKSVSSLFPPTITLLEDARNSAKLRPPSLIARPIRSLTQDIAPPCSH